MLRRHMLIACFPAVVFAAASESKVVTPTPAKAPAITGPTNMLVDKTIPAYGMTLYRGTMLNVSAAELARSAHRLAADVEAAVLSGRLHRVGPFYKVVTDDRGRTSKDAKPQIVPRQPLPEEKQLLDLFDSVVVMQQRLTPKTLNTPIPEHQLLDEALSELYRAADMLRQGLGDATYTDLDARAIAYQQRYDAAKYQIREAKIAELMNGKERLSRSKAEQAVAKMTLVVPDPDLSEIPAGLRDSVAVPTDDLTAPAAQPVVQAPAMPAPADDLPPVIEEAAPAPADDLPPLIEEAPTPAVEEMAPADELPTVEEPAAEEPAAAQPMAEKAAEEAVVEEAVEEAVEEVVVEEAPAPMVEAAPVEEPMVEEAPVNEPATAVDQPAEVEAAEVLAPEPEPAPAPKPADEPILNLDDLPDL